MNIDSMQGYGPYAAAVAVALVAAVVVAAAVASASPGRSRPGGGSGRLHRAVASYQAQAEQLLARRGELIAGITAIESGTPRREPAREGHRHQ